MVLKPAREGLVDGPDLAIGGDYDTGHWEYLALVALRLQAYAHQQAFLSTINLALSTILTAIASGIRLTAFGIFPTCEAEAGVIERGHMPFTGIKDTIFGDRRMVFHWTLPLAYSQWPCCHQPE